jgi:hypothetical protein
MWRLAFATTLCSARASPTNPAQPAASLGQFADLRVTAVDGSLMAGLRRPALGTAASQDLVLNVSKVASNSSAGAPGHQGTLERLWVKVSNLAETGRSLVQDGRRQPIQLRH